MAVQSDRREVEMGNRTWARSLRGEGAGLGRMGQGTMDGDGGREAWGWMGWKGKSTVPVGRGGLKDDFEWQQVY